MPRQPRVFVKDIPCHVIQRGNNRQPCFYDVCDYEFYLECLQAACEKHRCDLHAYILMTNHTHLLLTPADEKSLPKMMQSVGRRYVKKINQMYQRTGTLWEGRYKSSLVNTDNYLLACYRYIEMNPVRAGIVDHPAAYRWSSYPVNAGLEAQKASWLMPHPGYCALAKSAQARFAAYRELFNEAACPTSDSWMTTRTLKELPLGNDRFQQELEAKLNIKFNREKVGRPEAGGNGL